MIEICIATLKSIQSVKHQYLQCYAFLYIHCMNFVFYVLYQKTQCLLVKVGKQRYFPGSFLGLEWFEISFRISTLPQCTSHAGSMWFCWRRPLTHQPVNVILTGPKFTKNTVLRLHLMFIMGIPIPMRHSHLPPTAPPPDLRRLQRVLRHEKLWNYVTWPAWENWNVFQFNWCWYSN